ncbi:hypothetical protein, partial [Actinomadura rudentiformis]|uniref:hypothetical protein n=1 Tax=Actinomadura rudentiformis TaxID=359158 RepID=UPI001CEF7DB7
MATVGPEPPDALAPQEPRHARARVPVLPQAPVRHRAPRPRRVLVLPAPEAPAGWAARPTVAAPAVP